MRGTRSCGVSGALHCSNVIEVNDKPTKKGRAVSRDAATHSLGSRFVSHLVLLARIILTLSGFLLETKERSLSAPFFFFFFL